MSIFDQGATQYPGFLEVPFKLLLTGAKAAPVLKSVVSAILGRKVVKVRVANNEVPAGDVGEKQSRLDVNCVADGEQIDVEMQASRMEEDADGRDGRHSNLKSKSTFYLCDLHSSQNLRGRPYSELARTWQVTFCAYRVYDDERFFRVGRLRDEQGTLLAGDIALAFVELPKAAGLVRKPAGEMTALEQWAVFFGCADRPEHREAVEAIGKRNKEVGMAGTLLESISRDERERAIFRSRRMFQTDLESNLATARRNGILIGEKRGAERVKKQWDADKEATRQETVRILKAKGVPVEVIAEATSLTPGEVRKLDKQKKR